MNRPPHILNAASNLLGIALLIITAIKVSNHSGETFADEIAWLAAALLAASCLLSYLAIETDDHPVRLAGAERRADRIFLTGLVALLAAVLVLGATQLAG